MRVLGPLQVTTIGADRGAWSAMQLAATPETATKTFLASDDWPPVSSSTIAIQVSWVLRKGLLRKVLRITVAITHLRRCGPASLARPRRRGHRCREDLDLSLFPCAAPAR